MIWLTRCGPSCTSRRYHDAEREREARQLLTRLASGRFRLAVAGQFSRGKTTLMNALLGNAWLPMGALPMTSVITTVRYGSRSRALVRTRNAGCPVEAANTASTAATLGFLPQADAVVFVTGFDLPLTQAEADFRTVAARHAGKLFLVINNATWSPNAMPPR